MTILEAIAIDLKKLEDEYVFEVENEGNNGLYVHSLIPARKALLQAVQLRDAYQRANIVFTPYVNPTTAATAFWPPAAPPPTPPVKITFE